MRKPSQMGGGRFEYQPEELDERFNKRNEYLDDEFEEVKNIINERAFKYMATGLGTFEGYKEYILRELVINFRED